MIACAVMACALTCAGARRRVIACAVMAYDIVQRCGGMVCRVLWRVKPLVPRLGVCVSQVPVGCRDLHGRQVLVLRWALLGSDKPKPRDVAKAIWCV